MSENNFYGLLWFFIIALFPISFVWSIFKTGKNTKVEVEEPDAGTYSFDLFCESLRKSQIEYDDIASNTLIELHVTNKVHLFDSYSAIKHHYDQKIFKEVTDRPWDYDNRLARMSVLKDDFKSKCERLLQNPAPVVKIQQQRD